MSHFHQHTQQPEQTPETSGHVIHWALPYDKLTGRILRHSEASIRVLSQVKPGDKVLDVGCGSGRLTIAAQNWVGPTGEAQGIDPAPGGSLPRSGGQPREEHHERWEEVHAFLFGMGLAPLVQYLQVTYRCAEAYRLQASLGWENIASMSEPDRMEASAENKMEAANTAQEPGKEYWPPPVPQALPGTVTLEDMPEARLADLPEKLRQGAVAAGWSELMPVQAKAIPYLFAQRDMMIQSRTGSGKTGAYLLPILELINPLLAATQALVLVPTRELAHQVTGEAELLGVASGVRSMAVYGGVGYTAQLRCAQGRGAPGDRHARPRARSPAAPFFDAGQAEVPDL